MSPRFHRAPAHISEQTLRSLAVPGPRYTSYPTADRFVEAVGEADLRHALRARGGGGGVASSASFCGSAPLSVCAHRPFYTSVCFYFI